MTAITNSSGLDVQNSLKTISLYDEALKNSHNVSRSKHIYLVVASLSEDLCGLVKRAAFAAGNVFLVLLYPIAPPIVKATFNFRFIRLFLDPLDFLFRVIAAVVRVASCVFGFLVPQIAVRGWKLAVKIELVSYRLREYFEDITNRNFNVSKMGVLEITPKRAIQYFGKKAALTLEENSKPAATVQTQKQQSLDALDKFVRNLYLKAPTTLYNIIQYSPAKSPQLKATIAKFKNSIHQTLADDMKQKLTFDEIEMLWKHITSTINRKYVANNLSSPDLEEDHDNVTKAIANAHFGHAFGPYPLQY